MTLPSRRRFISRHPRLRALPALVLALAALAGTVAEAARLPGLPTASVKPMPQSRGDDQSRRSAALFAQAAARPPVEPVQLLYYGGRVLAQAQVVPVYWGTPDPAYRARLDAWYAAFVAGPQFDWLGEYSTAGATTVTGGMGTNQTLVHATFAGSFVIHPGAATTISEGDVKAELQHQVTTGGLPAPGAETLYVFHFPNTVTLEDGSSHSCQDYCAYHDSFTAGGKTWLIGVIPSHEPPSSCSGCGELDWFSNLNGSVSHEVVEAITDPDVGGVHRGCGPAWCDPGKGDDLSVHAEIGDICESGPVTEVQFADASHQLYVLQREWSNRHQACIGEARDAVSFQVAPYQLYKPGDTLDLPLGLSAPQSGPLPVALDLFVDLPGVTATLASKRVTTGGSTTLHLVTTSAAPARFVIGLAGETGVAQPLATITFGPGDFTVSGGAPLKLTAGGASAVAHLGSHNLAGAARSLTLTRSSVDGVTGTLAASPALGDSFDVTLTAAAGTPSGSPIVHLYFSDGHLSHDVAIPLTLAGDDFALVLPDKLSSAQGGDLSFTLQTQTPAGSPQTLRLSGSFPGGSVRVDPATVQSGQTAKVTVHVGGATPLGKANVDITAAGTLLSLSQEAAINVTPAGGCGSAGAGSLLALLVPLLWRRRPA